MLIDGDEIIACPNCNQLYKTTIYASWNNKNSIYYSDAQKRKPREAGLFFFEKLINQSANPKSI